MDVLMVFGLLSDGLMVTFLLEVRLLYPAGDAGDAVDETITSPVLF